MKFTAANAKQVLAHLLTGFNTTFNKSFSETEVTWQKIATEVTSTGQAENYAWLGKFPKLREWIGDKVIKRLEGHGYTFENMTWLGGCFEDNFLNMAWEMWSSAKHSVKAQAVPEGFVLVPMVPSERMINAVRHCYEGEAYLPYSLYSEFVNQAIIERMEAQEPTND